MRGDSVFKTGCLAMFPWSSGSSDHPLRAVRKRRTQFLGTLSRSSMCCMRTPAVPSIAPEYSASLVLQVFIRALGAAAGEQIDYNFDVKWSWFVGRLGMDVAMWKSCGVPRRIVTGCLTSDVAQQFFAEVTRPGVYERMNTSTVDAR